MLDRGVTPENGRRTSFGVDDIGQVYNRRVSEGKLVLYPRDPDVALDIEDIERALRDVDFIGRPIEVVGDRRFRPGDRFERLLDFNSPGRVFDEGRADPRRCTIGIPEVREAIYFLAGSNVLAPHCNCGFVFNDWSNRMAQWRSSGADWRCDGCGGEAPPWGFDWNHSAGFGRSNIDVHGIDLGEAVPSVALMQALQKTNNASWDYFYFVQ